MTSNATYEMEQEELIHLLCDLGLTPIQAKIYLSLLNRAALSARGLVDHLHINRADIYRALQNLQSIGIVETAIGSPNKYRCAPPKLVVKLLLESLSKNFQMLRAKANHLERALEVYSRRAEPPESDNEHDEFYRLKSGRVVIQNMLSTIGAAKSEVKKIVPVRSLSYHLLYGIMDLESGLISKGVKIRLITDVQTSALRDYTNLVRTKFAGTLNRVLQYIIVDERVALIRLAAKVSGPSDSVVLLTNNVTLTNSLSNHFEELWKALKS